MRFRIPASFAAVLAVVLVPSSPARAETFTAPAWISWCPAGDLPFAVTWFDRGAAIANGLVSATSTPMTSCSPDSANFATRTDSLGRAVLHIKAGGVGASRPVSVWIVEPGSDKPRFVRDYVSGSSPDQNGDLIVDQADEAILIAKMKGPCAYGLPTPPCVDFTADLDGNGKVTAEDLAILRAHMGHFCNGVTRARPMTWDRVKQIYR